MRDVFLILHNFNTSNILHVSMFIAYYVIINVLIGSIYKIDYIVQYQLPYLINKQICYANVLHNIVNYVSLSLK